MSNSQKKREFPHVFVVLFLIIVIAFIAIQVVPSGSFERVPSPTGDYMMVDPDSFTYIEKPRVSPFKLFTAIPEGMVGASAIIFTCFLIGGSWEVIHATGTVSALVGKAADKLKGRELWAIPVLMLIFCLIISFLGALELCLVFLPAIMPLMLALGFDTMTAAGVVLVGAACGFSTSLTNPFTVGIAHSIAGLPLYSGMGFRFIAQIVFYVFGVWYVSRYAKRVRLDSSKSYCFEESKAFSEEDAVKIVAVDYKTKHGVIGLVFLAGLAVIVYGVLRLGWFMTEIGAVFVMVALISAFIGQLPVNRLCQAFTRGCCNVMTGALVIGMARSILVIIEAGAIIDTIIYALVSALNYLPKSITILGVFIVQSLFNFVVGSGSGKTLITMPILTPMADLLGITRQTFVFATVTGDGITNIFYPTSGTLMGCTGYAKIPYQKWVRYIIPIIAGWSVISMVFLLIAQAVNYGPF